MSATPQDLETRARWHFEIGYEPELPPHAVFSDGWEDDDGELNCTHCGGEGYAEVDDPLWDECDEFGYGPCNACHGTGMRKHQWVF